MPTPSTTQRLAVFSILFTLCLLAYSNTFHASWHLDSIPNIVNNKKLHITELSTEALVTTFTASPTDKNRIYRPLSCLTFGINWYLGQDKVFGYHLFNILLHFLTGYLLYCTILTLFQTEKLKDHNKTNVHWIASMAAVFWLLSPIQTQAVTYIVQRMAALGTFFYLFSLYFFLQTRLKTTLRQKALYATGCFITFIAALASKENTITLPLAYLLIEIIFFQKSLQPVTRKAVLITIFLTILITIESTYLLLKIQEFQIFNLYNERSFSLIERFLSEHRIIIFYLSQLFFPSPQRLSLIHDFSISTSFWQPWTTLPSIILVYSSIITGFLCIPKKPIIAFSILFFFLTHIVESTILPLELIFEHRNYLPSLFLFLPFAIALQQLLVKFRKRRGMQLTIITFICLLIVSLCVATYAKNATWKDENTLWLNILKKAPNSARPYQNIGKSLINIGDYDRALEFYEKSLTKQDPTPSRSASISLNNIGNIYLAKQQYTKAIKYYNKALKAKPNSVDITYNKAGVLLTLGQWDAASQAIDEVLEQIPYDSNVLLLKGFILLKQQNHSQALTYFESAYTLTPKNTRAIIHYATAKSLLGWHDQANDLLLSALESTPSRPSILLSLLENSNRAGNTIQVQHYTNKLLNIVSLEQIDEALPSTIEELNSSILSGPMLRSLLIPTK